MSDQTLSYEKAGVSIGEQERAIDKFKDIVKSTYGPNVLSDVGSFGGLFSASFPSLNEPILVSSIDGVGTKTKVAALAGQYRGLGMDIVGHCVNDILVQGARPLFFLDYFASSKMSADIAAEVVTGIALACKENDCALIGGELAEMPGVYCEGEIDIVGAVVGVVEKSRLLPSKDIKSGDTVIGIGSDGLHTNGFSLARAALLERVGLSLDYCLFDTARTLGEELLAPHRSYFKSLLPILESGDKIKALAHITGGGLIDNLPRVLPDSVDAIIKKGAWEINPIFNLIQESGEISEIDMFQTFNMGIGMCVICDSVNADEVVSGLQQMGESASIIGELIEGNQKINFE